MAVAARECKSLRFGVQIKDVSAAWSIRFDVAKDKTAAGVVTFLDALIKPLATQLNCCVARVVLCKMLCGTHDPV